MSSKRAGTPSKGLSPEQSAKSIFSRTIGLSVHVDTRLGLRLGVPKLLEVLGRRGVKASFFVPMGKDHYGWTAKRVFTRRGFVGKASRMGIRGILATYGVRTLLYGLLLPGPSIPRGQERLLRRVLEEGHELGVHGLDHVYWHDRIKDLDQERTEAMLRDAIETYTEVLGVAPTSFASPGWMVNAHALSFLERHGFRYTSDTRGDSPFLPVLGDRSFRLLQIPTTLPTLDEVLGLEGDDPEDLKKFFLGCLTDGLNILTVHAELEGRKWAGFLDGLITEAAAKGFRFTTLEEIAASYRQESRCRACDIVFGQVRGRAGEVCCQKPAASLGR